MTLINSLSLNKLKLVLEWTAPIEIPIIMNSKLSKAEYMIIRITDPEVVWKYIYLKQMGAIFFSPCRIPAKFFLICTAADLAMHKLFFDYSEQEEQFWTLLRSNTTAIDLDYRTLYYLEAKIDKYIVRVRGGKSLDLAREEAYEAPLDVLNA